MAMLKTWIKPECVKIRLAAEEAVLAGCKSNHAVGMQVPDCHTRSFWCMSNGS
jgi:hypothetical protein